MTQGGLEQRLAVPLLPENVVNCVRVLKNKEFRKIMLDRMQEIISKYEAGTNTGNYARTYLAIALAGADRCERTENRYNSFLRKLEERRERDLNYCEEMKKREMKKVGSILNFFEESAIKRIPAYAMTYLIIPKILAKIGISEVNATTFAFAVVVPSWEFFLRWQNSKKEVGITEKYNRFSKGSLEEYDERIEKIGGRKGKEKEKIYSEALLGAGNAYNVFILGKNPVFDLTGRVRCLEEHIEEGKEGKMGECFKNQNVGKHDEKL